jgi:RNA polymerase sigma factor (sigma-70 family)
MKDERLARRAAGGDPKAFAAIYRRYHQDLYRFCLTIVRDPQDAQDALQNTMVKTLRALPGETRSIRLRPWLYRVAHNEAIEILRRRREDEELDPELAVAAGEPSDAAATRERLRHLLDDLDELPGRQRSALVMRELAGLGFDEIGTALETSEGAARQAVYEARLGLRQMEAGREMRCKDVMWDLSLADGRVARGREIQAHLRSCAECRSFRNEITKRRDDFAALAPLPLAASAGVLQALLGSGAAGGAVAGAGASGSLAGAAALGAGKSAVLKAAATVAVVAAGVTAADRGGLVEVPLPSDNGSRSSAPAPQPSAPAGGQGQSGQGDTGAVTQEERDRSGRTDSRATGEASPEQAAATRGAFPQGERPTTTANGNPRSTPGKSNGQGASRGGSPTAAAHKKGADSQPSASKGKGRGKESGAKAVGKPSAPPKGDPPPATKAKSKAEPPSVQEPEVEPDKGTTAPFQPSKPEKGATP